MSTAPLAICSATPRSRGMQVAKVVLPRPGGPSRRMWPSGSFRLRAASTAISSRSATLPLADHLVHVPRPQGDLVVAQLVEGFARFGSGWGQAALERGFAQRVAREDPFTRHA